MRHDAHFIIEKIVNGLSVGSISGLGRNTGTLDTSFRSRRTAQRHARSLRHEETDPSVTYRITEF